MKNVLIGLLLAAAAGTAAYFYFKKSKNDQPAGINRDLVTGNWSTTLDDSAKSRLLYTFSKEGQLIRKGTDSLAKADTAKFEWTESGQLRVHMPATDTAGTIFEVVTLTADSLSLKEKGKETLQILLRTN